MRTSIRSTLAAAGAAVMVLWTVAGQAVAAETFTPPLLEPKTVNIYTETGDGMTTKPRSFTLEAAAGQEIVFTPTALRESGGGSEEIPRDRLRLTEFEKKSAASRKIVLQPNTPHSLYIDIDRTGLAAGKYDGQLRFRSTVTTTDATTGKDKTIIGRFGVPVVVHIRDAKLLPALVILLGLALGISLSWYRSQRLPADELTVQVADVWEAAEDAGFKEGEVGYPAFAKSLRRATASIGLHRLEAAKKHLDAGLKILTDYMGSTNLVSSVEALAHVQAASRGVPAETGGAARANVTRYRIVSYGVALFFLGTAGFNELYLENPTFGDDGIMDYVALLAWGFGSQATTAALGALVTSWNLPGLSKAPGT